MLNFLIHFNYSIINFTFFAKNCLMHLFEYYNRNPNTFFCITFFYFVFLDPSHKSKFRVYMKRKQVTIKKRRKKCQGKSTRDWRVRTAWYSTLDPLTPSFNPPDPTLNTHRPRAATRRLVFCCTDKLTT